MLYVDNISKQIWSKYLWNSNPVNLFAILRLHMCLFETLLQISTDVAAQGSDIPDVEVVINCSFSLTTEDHVHIIERTGKNVVAHTFFTQQNEIAFLFCLTSFYANAMHLIFTNDR